MTEMALKLPPFQAFNSISAAIAFQLFFLITINKAKFTLFIMDICLLRSVLLLFYPGKFEALSKLRVEQTQPSSFYS